MPAKDPGYRFDPGTTMAILSGFADNRRVIVQGRHGTGKSTHIEQVAARLNWPLVRLNLDSHISRIDLIGKDAIVLRDGKQVTEYREGLLPWAYQRPVALVFDEYDAGRPDVMFVIQRVLEAEGRLTILDQNKVMLPHPSFRIFATANTIGLGDASGLYHGTQQLNQAQLDRWNIVARLDYLTRSRRGRGGALQGPLDGERGGPANSFANGAHRRTDTGRLSGWRRLDLDVASHGHLLGGQLQAVPRSRLRIRDRVSQSLRRGRAADREGILPASDWPHARSERQKPLEAHRLKS